MFPEAEESTSAASGAPVLSRASEAGVADTDYFQQKASPTSGTEGMVCLGGMALCPKLQ